MFKLLKVEYRVWWGHDSYRENPSIGNGFELYNFKDEDDFIETLWEMQCETAESCGDFDEEEQEWGDFVEENSDYIVVDYDPTNPVHIEHPGFEDERPEHVEWLEKEKVRKHKEEFSKLSAKIINYDVQIDQLKKLRAEAIARRTELSVENC